MLKYYEYDSCKTAQLIEGFSNGFDIGYRGPLNRRENAANLPFHVGDKYDLWEKLMKEVKLGGVAGPFLTIPFNEYIQLSIGLVPKAGNKTRLIFHLSYNFGDADCEDEERKSVNHHIPWDKCTVCYQDLDYAVKICLKLKQISKSFEGVFLAKSDLTSAFRILPVRKDQFRWLTMMAYHPVTGQRYFFLDKNLPFGASSSCQLFQEFSNSLRFLIEAVTGKLYQVCNYLDDYLFIEVTRDSCNRLVQQFVILCSKIGCPLSKEKTEWATQQMTFLGILLDA